MSPLLYDQRLKNFSRSLRKTQTDAELLLWKKIRCKQINGLKFRRQFPISGYIIDFYCYEKKLAIELDGSQHQKPEQRKYDFQRTRELGEIGIKLVRFWDNEVLRNINGVLEEILQQLNTSP